MLKEQISYLLHSNGTFTNWKPLFGKFIDLCKISLLTQAVLRIIDYYKTVIIYLLSFAFMIDDWYWSSVPRPCSRSHPKPRANMHIYLFCYKLFTDMLTADRRVRCNLPIVAAEDAIRSQQPEYCIWLVYLKLTNKCSFVYGEYIRIVNYISFCYSFSFILFKGITWWLNS